MAEAAEGAAAAPAAAAPAATRKPLSSLSRLEFLTDLLRFLKENGEAHLIAPSAEECALAFPEKKLNGRHLDLFALYKQVTQRGGYQVRSGGRHPFSWSGEIFPNMKHNYTRNHRATSVGHDLIKYYGTYLAAYEQAHPKDVIPYGVCGTPNSANAAARAAAAPLKVGDRIEVWWPLDKNWFAASVRALHEAEGAVEVAYDDGDQETLKLAQERWRRERVLSNAPSKKKRPRPDGPGCIGAPLVLPAPGEKRARKPPTFFQQDRAAHEGGMARSHHGGGGGGGHSKQHGQYGGGGAARAEEEDEEPGGIAAFGSSLARMRARAERRKLMAPVTRRTAAVLAAAAPRAFPPAESVAHWLSLRGFGALAPLFAAHEVDWEVLPMLTGEDLQDMGLDDFCTRLELLVHVTQECNSRAMDEVAAAVEGLTEREGEELAGVREVPLIDGEEELLLEDVRAAPAEVEEEEDVAADAPEEAADAQVEPPAPAEPPAEPAEADAELAEAADGKQAAGAECGGEERADDGSGDAAADMAQGDGDAGALDAAPAGAQDDVTA